MEYEIMTLYATIDVEGGFIEVSRDEDTAKKWMEADEEATQVVKGYGLLFKPNNLMPDNACDFHYRLEDAQKELEYFLNEM